MDPLKNVESVDGVMVHKDALVVCLSWYGFGAG